MKNKYKHGKAIAVTTMALAAVSLVTVGFSAWVITTQSTVATDNIQVTVGGIQDQTVQLQLLGNNGLVADNSTVNFDSIINDAGDITSNENLEDMTFGITFKADITNGFKGVKVATTEAADQKLASWASSKYVKLPFKLETTGEAPKEATYIPLIDSSWTSKATHYITYNANFADNTISPEDSPAGEYDVKVDVTAANNVITWVCTFNFHWGEFFNGKNPALDESANTGKTPKQIKDALDAMIGGTKFKMTLVHNPKVAVNVDNK